MTPQLLLDGPRLHPLSGGPATGLVVLLHGYRSDGNDLIEVARQFQPALPGVAFVAPHALLGSPSTGRRWFEITRFDPEEVREGAVAARPVLDRFLDAERDRLGIRDDRIVLVGFSQGGAMALHVGLRRTVPLGGIVSYAGFLPGPDRLDEIAARPPAVTLIHGDRDDVVPLGIMQIGAAALSAAGVPVTTFISRGIGHTIDTPGLLAGVEAIRKAFLPAPDA